MHASGWASYSVEIGWICLTSLLGEWKPLSDSRPCGQEKRARPAALCLVYPASSANDIRERGGVLKMADCRTIRFLCLGKGKEPALHFLGRPPPPPARASTKHVHARARCWAPGCDGCEGCEGAESSRPSVRRQPEPRFPGTSIGPCRAFPAASLVKRSEPRERSFVSPLQEKTAIRLMGSLGAPDPRARLRAIHLKNLPTNQVPPPSDIPRQNQKWPHLRLSRGWKPSSQVLGSKEFLRNYAVRRTPN